LIDQGPRTGVDGTPLRVRFSHNIFSLQRVGGISRYVVELHRALLRHQIDSRILAGFHMNEYLDECPAVSGVRLRCARVRRTFRQANELFNLAAGGASIFHRTFHGSKLNPQCAVRATTVYDMIPEIFPTLTVGAVRDSALKRRDCESADLICAISEVTRQDLHRLWGIPLSRIVVTHLGVTQIEPSHREWLSECGPYILHVGRRGGYKNFDNLLPSFARVGRGRARLVCFGGGGPTAHELEMIRRLQLEEQVVFASGSDSDLAACYRQALGHVSASRYEGFGLTPLEAMVHECPVACANRGAIPEVVGQAAFLFDPDDSAAQDEAMRWLLEGRGAHQGTIDRGRQRCAKFTWDATALATIGAYRQLLR
jgi:glycosyltransferase involved in cell wall biosynthesis